MFRQFFRKPHLFFLGLGLLTLLIAVSYFRNDPEAYLALGPGSTLNISTAICWSVFSGYTLILSGLYYIAAKGNLRTYPWLILAHFIFGLLFLALFAMYSAFETSYVQDRLSGLPLLTMIVMYGAILLLDLVMLVAGLALLVLNIFTLRKR